MVGKSNGIVVLINPLSSWVRLVLLNDAAPVVRDFKVVKIDRLVTPIGYKGYSGLNACRTVFTHYLPPCC